jgi:hypothetical protein
VVIPAVEAGLQRGTLVMQVEDSSLQSKISLPVLVAAANMLAMVFLDSQFTNYDSRNDLRFAHHIQHPVQKPGRTSSAPAPRAATVGRPNA